MKDYNVWVKETPESSWTIVQDGSYHEVTNIMCDLKSYGLYLGSNDQYNEKTVYGLTYLKKGEKVC